MNKFKIVKPTFDELLARAALARGLLGATFPPGRAAAFDRVAARGKLVSERAALRAIFTDGRYG